MLDPPTPAPLAAPAPLVVTLIVDPAAQVIFDNLRRAYFPPDRLYVGAHVTMFHALPGAHEPNVARILGDACADTPHVRVAVEGLRFLGRGVAFRLHAPAAEALRARLAAAFAGWLTPQDRQRWLPHVTVQNKVASTRARETFALLTAQTLPPSCDATGLALWRYQGGPWEAVARYSFRQPD